MNKKISVSSVAELRTLLRSHPTLRLEFLAGLSKLLRENGVDVEPAVLAGLSVSNGELPVGVQMEEGADKPDHVPGGKPKPVPGARPKPVPGARPKPVPGARPKPVPGARPKPVPGARPKPVPGARPKPVPGARPKPVPGASPKPG